jgi:hypothetical protein
MTQEVERLWFPFTPSPSIPGGVAPEFDEPGLVGMQLQAELGETLLQIGQELLFARLLAVIVLPTPLAPSIRIAACPSKAFSSSLSTTLGMYSGAPATPAC